MMKENSMISHVIIFFLLFDNINYPLSTLAIPPKITKEQITKLCSKSPNPSLCYNLLKDGIGHPHTNTTTSTMVTRPLGMADSHAKGTRKMLESLHKGAIDPKDEVKPRYKTCMAKYDDVIKFLEAGKKNVRAGKHKVLASYATSAVNQINSCDNEFASNPSKAPLALKNANKKVKDLCGIIVAVCNGV